MKKLIAMVFAAAGLSGCVAYPVDEGPAYSTYTAPGYTVYSAPVQRRANPNNPYGDRDRDGIANRYDRDRDGDGVANRRDARPNNPRWY